MKTDNLLVVVGEELSAEVKSYVKMGASAIVVSNDQELTVADSHIKAIKALKKKVREGYDDIISKAHATWKDAIAKRDEYLKPLEEAEAIIKGKMAPYMEEQARKVREAEERARQAERDAEEAERKAEEERQRAAREAMHDGDQVKAEKILAKPVPEIVPEKVDIPEVKELEGTHATKRWTYEVTNIDLVPRSLLMLDRVATNKLVQEKKAHAMIPGIRVFQKTGVSSGG